ncbi:MAG: glycosyltransferase family 9 protein [Sideroxydans sp.]
MPTSLPLKPRIAIVRFSALGDVVMVSAAINALRRAVPDAEITWFTSPLTYSLLHRMLGVQFVVVDKPRSFSDYRAFYRRFRERDFDAVLAMQANLRINLLYPALRAPIKIGFDRTRAREGQWLFCDQRIPFHGVHLVDSFLSFVEKLTGQSAEASWNLPVGKEDMEWAEQTLNNFKASPTLALPRGERGQTKVPHELSLIAIHPHASKAERNWLPERYAEVIQKSSGDIVLTGGNSLAERTLCQQLCAIAPDRTLDLCGKTSPKQLAALLGKVDVLIAPDTGAVHIARAMDTPVIGLYAVASPKLTGPYRRMEYCVDRYPQAVRKFLGKDPEQLPWNTRVHHPAAMSLIEVDDVLQQLSRVLDGAK